MGFDIDTENRGTGNNHMETKMRYHENYYVRFFIDFTDNIAVIHGEAGNTGLNGIGQEPAEHNINWKSVTYEGRGWELMSIVAGMSNIKIEYNK
ncbi:hypothetical protein GWA97_08605 [Flavobacterium sp. LaA7.5]|nr:hypothetical protein [Flavobacterium salilacus subsp. altitudinum]